jgi:hypothetical protein
MGQENGGTGKEKLGGKDGGQSWSAAETTVQALADTATSTATASDVMI